MIVKICGITSPETAVACFELGADMIGLVHFPPSQRHLDLPALADVTGTIAPLRESGKKIVLLIVDKNAQKVMRILDVCDHQFDFVQFYGEESEAELLEKHVRVLRPVRDAATCVRLLALGERLQTSDFRHEERLQVSGFRLQEEPDDASPEARSPKPGARPEARSPKPEACPEARYVVELAPGLYPGGNGLSWDWSNAAPFCRTFPTLLAGGITPNNVAEAIRLARPLGIDVSSGVESLPGVKDIDKVKRLIENTRNAIINGD